MTRIKVNGISSEADVSAANELFPDYVAFDFRPDEPRYLTPERALALWEDLDEDITVAGMFANAPARYVAALLNENLLDIAQLNGSEDAAYIEQVRSMLRAPDEKAIVQTFEVKGAKDLEAAAASAADMVALHIPREADAFDWSLLAGFNRPYFLGGPQVGGDIAAALSATGAGYVELDLGEFAAGMAEAITAVRAWDEANPRLSFLESLHPEFHEEDN